jgi:hypothetical protein
MMDGFTKLLAEAEIDEIGKHLDRSGLLLAEIRGHLLLGDVGAALATARRVDFELTSALSGALRTIVHLDRGEQ